MYLRTNALTLTVLFAIAVSLIPAESFAGRGCVMRLTRAQKLRMKRVKEQRGAFALQAEPVCKLKVLDGPQYNSRNRLQYGEGWEWVSKKIHSKGWVIADDNETNYQATLTMVSFKNDLIAPFLMTRSRANYETLLTLSNGESVTLKSQGTYGMPDSLSGGCGGDWLDGSHAIATRRLLKKLRTVLPYCQEFLAQ